MAPSYISWNFWYSSNVLMYAALASQKNHMAAYLSGIYSDEKTRLEFEEAYRASGKKMDVGKSCVRFKHIDSLPLDLIGKTIASIDVHSFIHIATKHR